MYLKRLELQGFKSFAGRTGFDFGQGITAIVGPNGSGKSNIADAIRWVMGEQSGRLIRAKKLDDIIYAGSAKRQAGSRVEVTLTFDNTDGWLPVNDPEVSISRRASRSGDSDYLLNGKKVRLRDLQVLLGTASLGQNSYAIIGQGLVEGVLNLRAEERRQLIEEAADIQRYRLKIEEAHGRLGGTHENVERIRLLMKEIAPRLNQLERQAKRAGEYSQLTRELAAALRVFYEEQWHVSQESLILARANHDQAQAEYTQAKVALETVQREEKEITKQLEEQRRATAAAAAERDRLDQKARDLERKLAVARERRSILRTRERELREEITLLEMDRERATALVNAEVQERGRRELAVEEARTLLQQRQAKLAGLEDEFRDSLTHSVDADAKARRMEAAAAELQARIRRLEDARRDLEKEASRLDTRRRSIITQLAEQLRVLRSLRAQEEQVMAAFSQASTRRLAAEEEVRAAREALAKVEATQNERRGRLEALEARLAMITDAQRQTQTGDPDEDFTLEGAVATVFEVIRVPRGLEQAIAAALSDQLTGFIFDRQAEAIPAIEALVEQNAPRTFVLPLDTLKQVYPLSLMKEKGVVGVASSLIKYQPRYEKLVYSLLGRTIVVQDATTAARLLKRGLGTIVTMDGVVFHPGGAIAAGRPRSAAPLALSFDRELESLPREIDKIRRSLDAAEREADSFRDRLRRAEEHLASLASETEEALERRMKVQTSAAERQEKLAHLRGDLRGLVGSQTSLREQQQACVRDAERLERERESLLGEASEASQTAKHLGSADTLFKERRSELQRLADEAADALARADGELRSLDIQAENARAGLARIEAQSSAKGVQLRGLEMELTTLDSTISQDEKDLEHVESQLEALNQRMRPGSDGPHHLEARERDIHQQVISCQNRLFEAERYVLEAEAEVRRWQTEIDTLRARMAEDGMELKADGSVTPQGLPRSVDVPTWLAVDNPDDPPGGLRPISGGAEPDREELGRQIDRLRARIRALGPVNVEAEGDYESLHERYDFLARQVQDLEAAEQSLHRAIEELTSLMRKRLVTTFEQVAAAFEQNFKAFFGGGHTRLRLTDPKNPTASGVEIEARPPGKRTTSLAQLSGGEKALTSVSLLFALLQANPSPFCVLDEVDAMLDEANVGRFVGALKDLSARTQFVIITHNRRTIEIADSIYGISMAPDATSRVLSMRLADVTA